MAIVVTDPRLLRGIIAPAIALVRAIVSPVLRLVRALLPIVLTALPLMLIIYIACSPYFGFRIATTMVLLMVFCGLAVIRPVYAILACILFAPWLGFIRRFFDSYIGPTGLDPLLAIIPLTLCLSLLSTGMSRTSELRGLLKDSLTLRLVLAFTALLTIEAVNPLQGGVSVALGGAMYRLMPLFVVFIVAAGDRPAGPWVMRAVVAIAVIQAVYGLVQTFFGFTFFEREFIVRALSSGYRSLSVGGVIRAFGTFVSAAEYVYYLDVAVGIAFAYSVVAWRHRNWGLALLGFGVCSLCGTAIIFEAHRLSMILLTGMALFVFGAQQRRLGRAVAILAVLVVVLFVVQQNLPTSWGGGSVGRLLSHVFGSLSGGNILDDRSAQGHVALVINALKTGFTSPLGRGLGAASQAAQKFGGGTVSSEFDVTDIIIAAGYLGAALYVTILFRLVAAAVRLFRRTGRPEYLAAGAGIVAGTGQILGPGYYAFCITLLAIAAWLIREEVRYSRRTSGGARFASP
ncbi:MAG: hypothetical protein IT305_13020 [Chloroflexi bacterium]|nr:hypothetical protein [Chloroflexota bacterium]